MKKLLTSLGALVLTAGATSGAVACDKGSNNQILIVLPSNSTKYNVILSQEAEKAAKAAGYDTKVLYVNENTDQEYNQVKQAVDLGTVKGIITAPTKEDGSNKIYDYVKTKNIPVVAVDRSITHKDDLVGETATDNTGGAALAAQEIANIVAGVKNQVDVNNKPVTSSVNWWSNKIYGNDKTPISIVELIGDPGASSSVQRHNGFIKMISTDGSDHGYNDKVASSGKALSYANLKDYQGYLYKTIDAQAVKASKTVNPNLTFEYYGLTINWDNQQAYTQTKNLIAQKLNGSLPDILISHNDPPVQGAAKAMKEAVKDAPFDHTLSFGFDGFKSTETQYMADNWVTGTLAQLPSDMAKWAAQRLVDVLQNNKKFKPEDADFSKPLLPMVATNANKDQVPWIDDLS